MNCGFCHKEIPQDIGAPEGKDACGACLGGCRKIHCPYCGFANPAPGKLLRRLLKTDKDNQDG